MEDMIEMKHIIFPNFSICERLEVVILMLLY